MKRILIVEDDPLIAAALRIRLQTHGYETLVAGDCISALSQAVRHRPQLLILDVSLPGGDGMKLAERFLNLPETQAIPVIFVTASREPSLRQRAMELHAAGFFEKPYDPEELLAVTQHALGETTRFRRPLLPTPCLPSAPVPVLATARSAPKILIVEDDPNIATALATRLRAAHFDVYIAHDALTGVAAAARLQPRLLLLDISIPAGSGFTVVERLRGLLPPATQYIFITASRTPGLRERAQAYGAAAFFEKPYDAEKLLATVNERIYA